MNLAKILSEIRSISILHADIPVEQTVGNLLLSHASQGTELIVGKPDAASSPSLPLGVLSPEKAELLDKRLAEEE
jgi:hypothetical protein